ncbi:MAG: magnesium/cobalt transporter CorA [Thermodesulfobacteriota bacterium]
MAKILKGRAKKLGLPPGSLVYAGDKPDRKLKVTILEFDEQECREREVSSFAECLMLDNPQTVTWLNVDGLQHLEDLKNLGECLNLHPLLMEDILSTDQRPKLDEWPNHLYLTLRMLFYNETSDHLDTEQLNLIIGSNYVITLHESDADLFDTIRSRIKSGQTRIRKSGADYLAYTILDLIVDNYFVILERFGETIEDLEEELVTRPVPGTLADLHKLKRDMIILRKSVWPLREVISKLERRESPLIKESTGIYLKDVYDHIIQVIDTIESFRDMLSGMLDIYLSSVSNKLNEIMKVLTIIATIFIPLTFVAGVYGMNFKYMPELQWHYGYYMSLALMALIAGIMLLFFKKKKWLGRK